MVTPTKNPWDDVPELWKNEKAFLQWLRSQTRRVWSRHPIKTQYKNKRRYKAPVGKNDKEVWVCDCELCGKQSRVTQIDHIEPGGSFTDWESYTQWAKRILWVTFDDIRELCVDCHEIITFMQGTDLTFEQAKFEKEVLKITKLKANDQKQWLKEKGVEAHKSPSVRIQQIRGILENGK